MATTKVGNFVDYSSSAEVSILQDAWPGGANPADVALWSQLSEEARRVVVARLKAIIAVERGARPAAEFAKAAGMDPTRFSRLRKRWRLEPSLRTVIPHAHRRVRRISPRYDFAKAIGDDHVVENEVSTAVQHESVSSIARRIIDRVGGTMSLQTATRLVREQIARNRREPSALREIFGDELRVDLSAVSLAFADGDDMGAAAVVVAVVLEVASSLILGHASGDVRESLSLQREAIANAIDFLGVHKAQPVNSRMTIVLGWADDERLRDLEFSVKCVPGVVSVLGKPGRFGKGLIDVLGHRIDRLRFRPKSTDPHSPRHRDVKLLSMPPMGPVHARALVQEAVANHNAPILALLNREMLLGPASKAGARMSNALKSLASCFNQQGS